MRCSTVGGMRILHTSDWHIGRTFHGVDLLADQESVLAEIAGIVSREQVDVVVLAGDVYDRSVPGAEAVRACNRALVALREAGATIVATSGNHDSPARLGAGADFAAAGGLHLFTTVGGVARPVVLEDEHGPVRFYGVPYLEPDVCRRELGVPAARTHEDVLTAAMDLVRAELTAAAAVNEGARSVVIAHAFVVGGDATDSERSISVGGVETVPAAAFEGVDYAALGHLHSPQEIRSWLRYSGSPLPYSFGERSDAKGVWIVDLGAEGLESVRKVPLTSVRGLSRLTGTLQDLLDGEEYADAEQDYVSALLVDERRPQDPMRRLRERFPHAVHLEWERPGGNPELRYRERVRGRDDAQIVRAFLDDMRGEATDEEMSLVSQALAAVTAEKEGER